MATCDCCGERLRGESGKICMLCIVKMKNYAEGDFDDENDPAVKLLKKTLKSRRRGRS